MRIISKHEMIEAFSLRASYAAGKIKLNVGKKFEGRWREVKAQSEAVIQWLQSEECAGNEQVTVFAENAETEAQMVEDDTIAEELEPTEHAPTEHAPTEHAPTEHAPIEHAPTDDEDGVRESLIQIFDIADAPGVPVEAIAEESAKVADDVCAMVQAAETGEPIPEQVTGKLEEADGDAVATDTNVGHKDEEQVAPVPTGLLEVQYVLNEKTGLEEHVGSGEPVIIFDGFLRAAWQKLVDKHTKDVNLWWRDAHTGDDGLLHTCALIGQAACACIAANSSGWAKVCREIDLSKILQTGPMSEEIGTMTASRGGKTVHLTLTREMVFDSFFLGNSYFGFDKGPHSGVTVLRDPLSMETLLAHSQGLRCPAAYKHATVAAVFPCLECYERESCYIRGPYAVCGCSDCEATVKMQEDGHEFFISERIKKFRKLIF